MKLLATFEQMQESPDYGHSAVVPHPESQSGQQPVPRILSVPGGMSVGSAIKDLSAQCGVVAERERVLEVWHGNSW